MGLSLKTVRRVSWWSSAKRFFRFLLGDGITAVSILVRCVLNSTISYLHFLHQQERETLITRTYYCFPSKQLSWRWVQLWTRNWELEIVRGAGMLGPSVPGMTDPASLVIVSYFIRTYYLVLPFADQIIRIHHALRWTLLLFYVLLGRSFFLLHTTSLMLRGNWFHRQAAHKAMPAVRFRKRSSWLCCRYLANRVTAAMNNVRGRKAAEEPSGGRHEGGRAAFPRPEPGGGGGVRNTRREEGLSWWGGLEEEEERRRMCRRRRARLSLRFGYLLLCLATTPIHVVWEEFRCKLN